MKIYSSSVDQVTQDHYGDPQLEDIYKYVYFDTGDEIIHGVWSSRYSAWKMLEKVSRKQVEHELDSELVDHEWCRLMFSQLFEDKIEEMRI